MSHDENSQVPAAEQPTGDDQWIFNLAADHEARGNGLYGPVTFSATGLVDFVKDVAAHLASQSQAAQPSKDLTDEHIFAIYNKLYAEAWDRGFDKADTLEFARSIERAAIATCLAGQSQATRAVPVAWMNPNEGCSMDAFLWQKDPANPQYSQPVYATPTAQEVTQQAAKAETAEQAEGQQANVLPVSYMIRDKREYSGHPDWSKWKPCSIEEYELRKEHSDIFEFRPTYLAPTTSTVSAPDGTDEKGGAA